MTESFDFMDPESLSCVKSGRTGSAWRNVVKELLLEEELCDAVIRVQDGEFKVHRIILCDCSSYLRDLFCGLPAQKVFSFPEVSADVMASIVEFAYTRTLTVPEARMQELLEAAERLGVLGVGRACGAVLLQQLGVRNCIGLLRLAESHRLTELRAGAHLFILRHFERVSRLCPDFVLLSAEQLQDFFKQDELNVRQESVVFEAMLRWISFSPEERRAHLSALMSQVRLIFMSVDYLVDTVSRDRLVRSDMDCVTMVTGTMKALQDSNLERPVSRCRLPAQMLVAVGGLSYNSSTARMELYNVRSDRWTSVHRKLSPLPEFSSCAWLQGALYSVGGSAQELSISRVLRLDAATLSWREVRPLQECRCSASVAVLDGLLYALGGWNAAHSLNTAERYDPAADRWTSIAPMHHQRTHAGAATLHRKIYVFGGFSMDQPLSSAETYDPTVDQWTQISSMDTALGALGAIGYRDLIFVVGGCDGEECSARVVTYDPVTGRWGSAAPMVQRRSAFGLAVLEEQLYAVGGFSSKDRLLCSAVERYDGAADRWRPARGLEAPRGAVSCCVVERVPHAAAMLA